MGSAYQCDRCQAFDTGTPVMRFTVKTVDPPVHEKMYELCPKCLMGITAWLDECKKAENE